MDGVIAPGMLKEPSLRDARLALLTCCSEVGSNRACREAKPGKEGVGKWRSESRSE